MPLVTHDTIVCFHIPKSAGTSLVAEIGRIGLPWAHIMGGLYSTEHQMVLGTGKDFLSARKTEILSGMYRIIVGHFTQRNILAAFGREKVFRYATILRDPVERLYSEYRYITTSLAHPGSTELATRFATFESFVESSVDGNIISHYLEEFRGEQVSSIVDRLLETYAFVGTVATYNEDIQRFRALFGASTHTPFRLNVSSGKHEAISTRTLNTIHERNSRDIELYNDFVSRSKIYSM